MTYENVYTSFLSEALSEKLHKDTLFDKEQILVDTITQEHSSARSSNETTGANPKTEACPGKFLTQMDGVN